MAIPAMISEFSQQQLNYGAAVGQSLIALGQQVGQQLATREYQRQAQVALPALQQTYSSALDKIESGDVSAGYRDLMNAQLQFGATQNPFLTTINDRASKLAEDAANNVMKTRLYDMQYGGRGGGGTPAGKGTSLLKMFSGGTGGRVDANVGGMADFIDQEAADQLPKEGASAGTTGNWSFQTGAYERPTKEIETTANQEFEKYSSGDVAEQESYRTSVMSPQTPQGTEFVEQPGLNRFKGFEQVTGVFIPREKTIDFPEYSVRKGETGAISENIKFSKKTINEKQKVKAEELAYNDLPTAIARISQNQSLEKYFLENSPETLDIGSKKDESGQQSFFIGVRGQKDSYMPIEQDDFFAATIIRRLPSSSKTLGAPLAITAMEESQAGAAAPTGVAAPSAPAERPPLIDIATGKRSATPQPTAAPTALPALDVGNINPNNPFAGAAKKELETQALAKQVGATMRTQAEQITNVREARDRIKEIDNTISALKRPAGKAGREMREGTYTPKIKDLASLNAVEKYQMAERLLAEKKKLEEFLASK